MKRYRCDVAEDIAIIFEHIIRYYVVVCSGSFRIEHFPRSIVACGARAKMKKFKHTNYGPGSEHHTSTIH